MEPRSDTCIRFEELDPMEAPSWDSFYKASSVL